MSLIPADSLTDWTPGTYTGVPGGIPTDRTNVIDVTLSPYFADNTGATDASEAIQAAIDAATAGDIVYIPAGEYRIDVTLGISHSKDEITIRGDGPASTILKPQSGAGGFSWGSSDGWSWPFPAETVTAGLTKDSTSITLADASQFSTGALILISFDDVTSDATIEAGAAVVFGVGGWDPNNGLRKQVSRVTGKVGNVLSIFPGIYHAPVLSTARISVAQLQLNFVGIEDLAIDMTDSAEAHPVYIQHAYGCWVKNVKVSQLSNYGVTLYDSLQCEVRHSELRDRKSGGSNGAALLVNTTCGSLLEDNVLYNAFPIIEVNAGSSGNVFGYNICENPNGEFGIMLAIDTNHAPHNSHNLYEGNITPSMMCDGYFGGASEDTIFRNWIHNSLLDDSATSFGLSLKRFTRNYNIVGNIIGKNGVAQGYLSYGQPHLGNGDSVGTAQPSLGDFWADWKATATLTTRAGNGAGTITLDSGSFESGQLGTIRWGSESDYQTFTVSGVSGDEISWTGGSGTNLPAQDTVVQVFMQPGGYNELDEDVEATVTEKGNYLYGVSGAAGSMSSLGGDTLPGSLYTTQEGLIARGVDIDVFPAFDPTSPNSAAYANTPAGYRFENGEDPEPSPEGGTLTVTAVTIGTLIL